MGESADFHFFPFILFPSSPCGLDCCALCLPPGFNLFNYVFISFLVSPLLSSFLIRCFSPNLVHEPLLGEFVFPINYQPSSALTQGAQIYYVIISHSIGNTARVSYLEGVESITVKY